MSVIICNLTNLLASDSHRFISINRVSSKYLAIRTNAVRAITVRICLYSEKILPKVGGQELVVDALARNLVALGHEPVVLAPKGRGKTTQFDRALPYRVKRHPRFYSTRRFVNLYAYWLARAQRRYRFDLVHCHGVYPSGYIAAKCAAVAQTPIVITSHGGDVDPVSPLFRNPCDGARPVRPGRGCSWR